MTLERALKETSMMSNMLLSSHVLAFVSFLVLATLGFAVFVYVRRQLSIAQLADGNLTTDHPEIPGSSFDFGDPVENLRTAIRDLTAFAQKSDFDQIVGVHTGGRLASVLVCESLGVSTSKCGFISTDIRPNREPQLHSSLNSLHGDILIIDDVTRTGSTLEIIRRNIIRDSLLKENAVRSVSFATLLVAKKRERLAKGFFVPDWWAFTTESPDTALPWSRLSTRTRAAHLLKLKKREYDERFIEIHSALISDHGFSLYCAKLSLYEPKIFAELVDQGQILSHWVAASSDEPISDR